MTKPKKITAWAVVDKKGEYCAGSLYILREDAVGRMKALRIMIPSRKPLSLVKLVPYQSNN